MKAKRLKFLVHVLSDSGIEVDPEKALVISTFRDPANKEELRSFLGLVTYVGKFIPDLATRTDKLRELLKENHKFLWEDEQRRAFNDLKSQLASKYYPFRFEISAIGDILLRGTRNVIPGSLRERILQLAHEGHPGESAMKRRLRAKVWWPSIDREVEKFVKCCKDCLLVSPPSKPAPMNRHVFPNGPWISLASDLLGPLPNGQHVFVLIDYYSRYMESKLIRSITSQTLIEAMREIFSRLGIPKYLKTDNGRQYVSKEFDHF
ncbi:hypothetical protein ACLKA6_019229 [Drosophila palustris]